jgi:hypothetical protein
MRHIKPFLADRLGGWLDQHGTLMQPAATKRSGRPVSVMGHLVFLDAELPYSRQPRPYH